MRAKVLLVPLAALLAVGVLTGCDPAGLPIPTPTPSVSEEATPSAEAVDDETTTHSIRVSTTSIDILDADGVAVVSIIDGMTTDAVPLLTAAFGFEPTVSHVDGGDESVGATVHEWDGFQFRIPDNATFFPPYSTWYVNVSTAAVGGVAISTGDGIQVGDPMSDAVAQQSGFQDYPASGDFAGFYEAQLLAVAVDPASVGEPGGDLKKYVGVYGPAGGGGAITGFAGPSANWGV